MAWIYSFFSHGVSSPFMTWMFLVPLLLGALPGFLWAKLQPCPETVRVRMGGSLYAGGMAALVNGMMLRGILDIAGTSSPYIPVFWGLGGLLMVVGGLLLLIPAGKTPTEPTES